MDLAPRSCVAAINREYADAGSPIAPGDEVALVPPVSGGDPAVRRIAVTGEPLDVAALSAAVRDPRAGAVVLFEGVTREVTAPRLRGVRRDGRAAAARDRRGGGRAPRALRGGGRAPHGHVPLGEPSVIVAVSAPHRGEAFAGARAVIDRVKAEAPIWKVEVPRTVTAAGSRGRSRPSERGPSLPMQCSGR